MKNILLGLLTIGLVGGVAIGASQAFFTDTETSTGNKFIAGTLDLEMGSTCSYNGSTETTQCGTWTQRDLNPEVDKFFNFTDVKPGDWGENTIDFKVLNNDAWMCANVEFPTPGKLADYLNVFWWIDANGNNKLDTGEKVLYGGPRTISEWITVGGGSGSLKLTFADSVLNWVNWPGGPTVNTTPIYGDAPNYLGVGWCFGSLTLEAGTGVGFTCSGSGTQDDAQGTSVVANMTFTAEQSRNNPGFTCPEH